VVSRGSLSEQDTQFNISKSLGYISDKERNGIDKLMMRVDKMLFGLMKVK